MERSKLANMPGDGHAIWVCRPRPAAENVRKNCRARRRRRALDGGALGAAKEKTEAKHVQRPFDRAFMLVTIATGTTTAFLQAVTLQECH